MDFSMTAFEYWFGQAGVQQTPLKEREIPLNVDLKEFSIAPPTATHPSWGTIYLLE